MSRHLLILHLILLATLASPAHAQPVGNKQSPPQRWSLSLTAGPSIPVGRFAATDPFNNDWGAHAGAGAEFALTWWANPFIGLTVATTGQSNPIGTHTNSGWPLTLRFNSWKIARFLGGLTVSPPPSSRKFSVDIRGLVGTLKTGVPGYTIVAGNDPRSGASLVGVERPDDHMGLVMTWEAGADIKWKIKKGFFLLMDAGYQNAKAHLIQCIQASIGAGFSF